MSVEQTVADDAWQRQDTRQVYTHRIKRTPPERSTDAHHEACEPSGSGSGSGSGSQSTAEADPTVVGSGTDTISITSKKHKTHEHDCLHEFYVSKGLQLQNGQYESAGRQHVESEKDDRAEGARIQTDDEAAQHTGVASDDAASSPTEDETPTRSAADSHKEDSAPSATFDSAPVDFDALLEETTDGIPPGSDSPPEEISFSSKGNKISGPRNYQQELTQLAKSENVIAFLETGSGKTFIAVMLIKEMVAPRALAYSRMLAADEQTSPGVVKDRDEMQKLFDAKMKIAIAARKGRGLSLARRVHMEQFGASQAGFVVPTDRQVSKVLNAIIKEIVHGGVVQSSNYEQLLRPEEVSEICSNAVASGILERLAADEDTEVSPAETSDLLRVADHKMVVFLVPRVPLVFQQAEVIRLNTELDVGEYCGEHSSDHFNLRAWEEEFSHRDVLVMTPQIFLNILRHGFVKLSRFQLMIFDEAHHATQYHPYNLIMQEFYWAAPAAERPKVFGMTASPVKKSVSASRESHVAAIMQLESNLGCRVVTVSKHAQTEVNRHAPKPQEAELEHQPPPMEDFEYATFPATAKRLIDVLMQQNPTLGADAFIQHQERLRKRASSRYEGEHEDGNEGEDRGSAPVDTNTATDQTVDSTTADAAAGGPVDMEAAEVQGDAHKRLRETQDKREARQKLAARREWKAKMEKSALYLLRELGPWAAHGFLDRLTYTPRSILEPGVYDIWTDGVCLDIQSKLPEHAEINDSEMLCPHRWPPEKCEMTPKVRALLEILNVQSRRPRFSGIVFVQRRQTAIWLAELVRRSKHGGALKAAAVVGHGEHRQGDTTTDSMHLKDQHKVLTGFRKGEINLLVATSLVEEGLDVMACTLVVRFNAFDTLSSYVQSRGRARHPYSLYVVMVESKSKEKMRKLLVAAHTEERLVRQVANEDRALLRVQRDGEQVSEEFLGKDKQYRVEETGALATVNSAVSLIYHYCTALPRDRFCHMAPIFMYCTDSEGTVCTLELPINAALGKVKSSPCSDEFAAKQDACLLACKRLHECRALTDHLLPRKLVKEGIAETELDPDPFAALGKGRRIRSYTTHGPRCLCVAPEVKPAMSGAQSPSITVFVYRMYAEHKFSSDNRTYAFVSHSAIPFIEKFEVYDKSIDSNFNTGLQPLGKLQVDMECLTVFRKFNAALWACLTSVKQQNVTYTQGREQTTYMVLPLASDWAPADGENDILESQWSDASNREILLDDAETWTLFDKTSMDNVLSMADPSTWQPVDLSQLESLPGQVVVTRYNMQKYLVRRCTEKTPLSPFPLDGRKEESLTLNEPLYENAQIATASGSSDAPAASISKAANISQDSSKPRYTTYADYYEKSWKEKVRSDQPLIHADFTGVRHMIPHIKRKIKASDSVLLVPELCLQFPLAYTAFFIPSVCIRVERQLLLQELRETIGIPVDHKLFEEAMTTPSGNPLVNYERLENLGDALLKYAVSMHLFLKYPKLHEGQLSVMRMQMVNNRILCEHAVNKKVFHYMIAAPPLPKSWAPPGCPRLPQLIGDKTMADVMESLIGAYYKTRNSLEDALKFMSWAGIMVCDPEPVLYPHKFWAREGEPRRRNLKEALSLAAPLANFEKLRLGYIFTHKALLLEAFTHASFRRAATPCYQRLEFLGDAVLDYYVTTDLYNSYPDIGPGKMSDLRMAGVNNEVLAAIAVTHGYHHCLYHHSADLLGEMTVFVRWIAAGGTVAAASADEERAVDAPKILGDIFESVAGAVMLDSGPEATGIVVRRLMRPYLDRYATPETVVRDPRRLLQEICTIQGIFDYTEYRIVQSPETGGMGIGVFLRGQLIGFGEGGRFFTAKRAAARRACQWLEQAAEAEALQQKRAEGRLARNLANAPAKSTAALETDGESTATLPLSASEGDREARE